jgi:transketolase
MRAIPGMTVINPSDAVEAAAALKYAIENDGPFYIRFGRNAVPVLHNSPDYEFHPNQGEMICSGTDATIVTTGMMLPIAIEAAMILATRGIRVRIINMHTVKPLDRDIIRKAALETGAIVTAEEHNVIGGLGSAVAECVAEYFPVPVIRMGVNDCFGRSGTVPALLEAYGLTAEVMINKVMAAIRVKEKMKKTN